MESSVNSSYFLLLVFFFPLLTYQKKKKGHLSRFDEILYFYLFLFILSKYRLISFVWIKYT